MTSETRAAGVIAGNDDYAGSFLHDPSRGTSENRALVLVRLRQALDIIEQIYTLGFSKPQIATSLLINSQLANQLGLAEVVKHESRLASIRNAPEFLPALITAQKGER